MKFLRPTHPYVPTWAGFVYLAVVIDAFAVGSSAGGFRAPPMPASFSTRSSRPCTSVSPVRGGGLVHHSDRGVQYVSIKYTERLIEAGLEPSVGSVGDSYDNALAETINGLYKAEVIHRRGPWRSFEAVEFATLEWVDWFNNRRLLEPIGNIPPAEAEARYYAQVEGRPWPRNSNQMASGKPGAVHGNVCSRPEPDFDGGPAPSLKFKILLTVGQPASSI